MVLFDEASQVIGVYQNGMSDYVPPKHEDSLAYNIYYGNPDEGGKFEEWPEIFRGNVTGIITITWIDEAGKLDDHL